METPTTTIAGRAVYMEFRKGPSTTQVLLMPEGRCTSGHTVPMTMYRRRVSPAAPRKTWRMVSSAVSGAVVPGTTTGPTGSLPIPVDMRAEATRRLSFSYTLFDSLKTNEWKLYKEAIVVEVLPTDLDDARMGRTPYKTLGRILKTRKFLGFPKEIFGAV